MEFRRLKLPFKTTKVILALGSQSKNTVCFLQNDLALLSPQHPELNDPGDYLDFKKSVHYFLKRKPNLVVYDLHPEYQSSRYALELSALGYRICPIQHHHAHITSCMAENSLKNQRVIGVAFDGTGLGQDNRLWGAEFLVCDYKGFRRMAYLKEIGLIGGEKAIIEPWRIAAAWLYLIYKDRFLDFNIGFSKKIDKKKWRILKNIFARGFNVPLASSMGRLFDAAAALILEKEGAKFEAELAIELEKTAAGCRLQATCLPDRQAGYKFRLAKKEGAYLIDPQPMFKEIVTDLKAGIPKAETAFRFHLTVAEMIKKVCLILRKETKINKVIVSGGVFQNHVLSGLATESLKQEDFNVFRHNSMPPNDSGISLGQACAAHFQN